MAIRSLGLSGEKSLPPGALKELLFLLSPKDWVQTYQPSATIWTHGVPKVKQPKVKLEQKEQAKDNTEKHLQREIKDVSQTINALLHGARSPSECDGKKDMLRNALLFFETTLPHEAMQTLLTETHAGELSWVKAMQKNVREDLLSVLSGAHPISLQPQDKQTVANTLKWHKQYLHHALRMEDDR